jgi:hypothetical protein
MEQLWLALERKSPHEDQVPTAPGSQGQVLKISVPAEHTGQEVPLGQHPTCPSQPWLPEQARSQICQLYVTWWHPESGE